MLKVENLEVDYGAIKAIKGISFEVAEKKIVTLIGANGAGKTTTLRTISGLMKASKGKIIFKNQDIFNLPAHQLVSLGISHVPEGRRIFATLTVQENLDMAAWLIKSKGERQKRYDTVFELFPRLKERRKQLGGTLSGGEQQMLAVARALVTGGDLLLFDEPSMGLAPVLVEEIFNTIIKINKSGSTILLVEQNAKKALEISDYAYVLEVGTISFHGPAKDIANNPKVKEAYLGI
ncbi:MAG: ABC transporter ATP-binding protein [Spirochaetales bacterium]|jgi:branched-chain amino acid transport system ATP-binding protein|nr:ABC transporter ATP-binding protein [Exilispira sp.]NMC67569.1 ABC transporter ATP-binding protein [Spirochaetales bacterium]